MIFRGLLAIGAAASLMLAGQAGARTDAKPSTPCYDTAATAAGARSVTITVRADGGMVLGGELEGRQFALAIPKAWNHQALLFAHGYTMPDSSVAVSRDPVADDPTRGLLGTAYGDGFAVGHSAYDKAGVGVESGAKATLRLERLVERLGATRTYVGGASMGGNIVMALIEQNPRVFAGAISACGVTHGWEMEVGALIDMRAVYNALTRGTPYALPGDKDLARSALPTLPPADSAVSREAYQTTQLIRIASPLLKLFTDARRDPQSQAATIVRKVSSLTAFPADPAAFVLPLVTAGLGMDDMRATFGGNVYGNRDKTYASAALTVEEAAALNRDIQRIDAEPAAVAYARRWHQTVGNFRVPLVAIHNEIDPLVPYSQAQGLRSLVEAHGNLRRLTLITVPPERAPIPGSGVEGYVHCGFTPDQLSSAWRTLRGKVEP